MRYYAGERTISCPCCGHDSFDKDYRMLNSRGASFLGLDWANKNATILVCGMHAHPLVHVGTGRSERVTVAV